MENWDLVARIHHLLVGRFPLWISDRPGDSYHAY